MSLPYENATSGERAHNFIDIAGRTFGKWTALRFNDVTQRWVCRCECGCEQEAVGTHLRSGRTKSCRFCKNLGRAFKHGQASERNGFTRKYRAWVSMLARTRDKTSPRARWYANVPVHPEWAADFRAFDQDVPDPPDDKLTLDRINPFRGYEPGNVRWATMKEQAANRRANWKRGSDAPLLPAPSA